MAKKKRARKKNGWTKDEQSVFEELGIGEGEVGLRRLIRGQRRINGRLYEAIELIIDSLPKKPGQESESAEIFSNRKRAQKFNAAIPAEDPPRCEKPGGG